MVKLAVFDLDDTLLKSDKTLDSKTVSTIHALKKRGIAIAIATGRNIPMSMPFAKTLGCDGLLAGNNGSVIIDIMSEKVVETHHIDKTAQAKTIEYATRHNLPFVIYTQAGVYTPNAKRITVYEDWNARQPEYAVRYEEVASLDTLKALDAHKILMIIESPEMFKTTYAHFQNLDDAHATKSSTHYIDVLPQNISKAYALRRFMEYYGVDAGETMAFGDSDNDSEMLEHAGVSYAMKNATTRAKHAADKVTDYDNNNTGVARVLKTSFKL